MNDPPRYLVAKYISDLQRMEPRNIGVIVWSGRAVWARFLAEKAGAHGQIDGRSIPSFVTSTAAYKQWVRFWRDQLNQTNLIAKQSSQQWLENLKQTSRGNFLLADGGMILDAIESSYLPKVTDELFQTIVESSPFEETRDLLLDQVADTVI